MITPSSQTIIFECGCLGGDIRLNQKDMCLKDIGLHAQMMLST